MNDPTIILREFLVADAALCAVIPAANIIAAPDFPANYSPDRDGAGLLIGLRSAPMEYSGGLIRASLQMRVYAATEEDAINANAALFWALHEKASLDIASSICEGFGQLLQDPEAKWPFELSYWRCLIRNQAPVIP